MRARETQHKSHARAPLSLTRQQLTFCIGSCTPTRTQLARPRTTRPLTESQAEQRDLPSAAARSIHQPAADGAETAKGTGGWLAGVVGGRCWLARVSVTA